MKVPGAPVRAAQAVVSRLVRVVRRDAPAARMVGEFAVKTGLREAARRIRGGMP